MLFSPVGEELMSSPGLAMDKRGMQDQSVHPHPPSASLGATRVDLQVENPSALPSRPSPFFHHLAADCCHQSCQTQCQY